MEILTTIDEVRARLDSARGAGVVVGLVPTMGYLHAGHGSLMERSVADCGLTLATVFVNPLQFAPDEDLEAYPRDLDADSALAARIGVDLVFAPSVDEMYPEPITTTVTAGAVAEPLEGEFRPTHFAGVATVVAKLFSIVGPCRAYFGEKDFQQLAVIRKMALDLSMPVTVVGCPTVREPDGLAMSSRNVYLEPHQRAAAPVLYRALRAGARAVEAGAADPAEVVQVVADELATEPEVRPDYVALVDPATFATPDSVGGEVRLLVAARVGRARLIDNVGARSPR